jgi:hypothetical protein
MFTKALDSSGALCRGAMRWSYVLMTAGAQEMTEQKAPQHHDMVSRLAQRSSGVTELADDPPDAVGLASDVQAGHLSGPRGGRQQRAQHLDHGHLAGTVGAEEADRTPLHRVINGALGPRLGPPLRVRDYRMDAGFGLAIEAAGTRILQLPRAELACRRRIGRVGSASP